MTVKAILFDADGVIQRPTPARRSLWAQLLGGAEGSVDAFLQDLFEAERGCYTGSGDFIRSVRDLLERWNCAGDLSAALQAWIAIDADPGIRQVIALLRASGYPCYLASNQEPYRARYMSETLAYRALFDGEFYSCTVGYAKPDPAYFAAILKAIAVPAEHVLFIDDHSTNVHAALSVGLRASVFAPADHERWHGAMEQLLVGYDLALAPGD